MAHHVEPMDVDCMDSEFDNKENSFHHSNVHPSTEKGYEELDVSELNMKLRYSVTPAASPMSKSYSAFVDNRNLENDDSLNWTNENSNLTRSLNATMTNDSVIKSLKSLPLQTISTEQNVDNRSSVLRQLDSTITAVDNDVTVTVHGPADFDDNLSLPSSSSSATYTPEATTPTNINKNEEGSPIIRGLKSVLNMFRSSQSPIPPVENENNAKQEVTNSDETYYEEEKTQTFASTPIAVHRNKEATLLSRRSSPLKDSITFNEDLEKELQWKEDTILFSEEKIPIHKLFLPLTKPTPTAISAMPQKEQKPVVDANVTIEYMDVSCNSYMQLDHTISEPPANAVESDGEFVDCETTFTKNDIQNVEVEKDSSTEIVTENKSIESINNEAQLGSLDITQDNLYSQSEDTFTHGEQTDNNGNTAATEADSKLNVTEDIVDNASNTTTDIAEKISSEHIQNETQKEPEAVAGPQEDVVENISSINKSVETKDIGNKPASAIDSKFDVTRDIEDDSLNQTTNVSETKGELVDRTQENVVEISTTIVSVGTKDNDNKSVTEVGCKLDVTSYIVQNALNQTIHVSETKAELVGRTQENVVDISTINSVETKDNDSKSVPEVDCKLDVTSNISQNAFNLTTNVSETEAELVGRAQENVVKISNINVSVETKDNENKHVTEVGCKLDVTSNIVQDALNQTAHVTKKESTGCILRETQKELETVERTEENLVKNGLSVSHSEESKDNKSIAETDLKLDAIREIADNADNDLNQTVDKNKHESTNKDLYVNECQDKLSTEPRTVMNITMDNVEKDILVIDSGIPKASMVVAGSCEVDVADMNKMDEIPKEIQFDQVIEDNAQENSSLENTTFQKDGTVVIENVNQTFEFIENVANTTNDYIATDQIVKTNNENVNEIIEIIPIETHEINSEIIVPDKYSSVAKEPANIPLPDDKDFDIALAPYSDKVETMQNMPIDVLDSKFDNKTDNINEKTTINLLVVNAPSKNIDILNETKDIVDSLTEFIDKYQNNKLCMLDLSQNVEPMKGIECTDELALPDLVNQSEKMNECTIDASLAIQSEKSVYVEEMHKDNDSFPNLNEKQVAITEQTSLDTPLATNSTEKTNESIFVNKDNINASTVEKTPENTTDNAAESKIKEPLVTGDVADAKLKNIKETLVDEEIVLSGNNSPYVSVIAESEMKPADESFEKIDMPILNEAPSSPPIRSKGYNFNFDEMDDPFATNAKIRQSPPPTPSKMNEPNSKLKKESTAAKKAAPNRGRSQPPERKRPTMNKKKMNTTINVSSPNNIPEKIVNDQIFESDLKNMSIENLSPTKIAEEIDVTKDIDSTQVLNKTFEKIVNEDTENDHEEKEITADITVQISSENKSDNDSMINSIYEIKTSSSEHSTYVTGSSSDCSISKNVFNLPEIEDKNFNPFATKSKMRLSPANDFENDNPFATKTKINASPNSSIVVLPKVDNTQLSTQNIIEQYSEDKMDIELMEKDASYNVTSSSLVDDKNVSIREVNTEDEDTEEGPCLEAEDAIDKLLDIGDNMMQFNKIPAQLNEENADGGELFIDAEAFEFLLNQNKCNVVSDSGKESLFLKFDPLFAKRISSDGVCAALSKVQKRQSTLTKPTRPSLRNEASPIPGPSNVNTSYEVETNATQDSIEDLNVTVAKPMMVVTPAVNAAVTPRNKTTPPRSNRRSINFTSPAMAVIDRLLSLSGNTSLLGHDTTVTQTNREHNEADLALVQLRELLAEKEICVYQLRSESKELKDRLSTMETQVKILETEGQDRLNNIKELNDRLAEKTKINKGMAAVVEEYERTIASLIAETEQDKKRNTEERMRLINERDEQTAHLASMEVSFSDLHSKYEKSKQVILSCKANEETCKKSIEDLEENLAKMQANYEMLKQHATSKLDHANQELQKMTKAHESEVLKLNAMIKRKDMHITSLEETLAQKTKANEELTAICDELINKVA